MKRIKLLSVAAAIAAFGILGTASSASAAKCADSIEDACRVAAQVICRIAKPCLY